MQREIYVPRTEPDKNHILWYKLQHVLESNPGVEKIEKNDPVRIIGLHGSHVQVRSGIVEIVTNTTKEYPDIGVKYISVRKDEPDNEIMTNLYF